jgi:hypothetical protein
MTRLPQQQQQQQSLLGLSAAAIVLLCMACSKTTPEPEKTTTDPASASSSGGPLPSGSPSTQTTPSTLSSASSSGASAAQPEDITWDAPKTWQSMPNPSPMRKATFKIPKVAGDPEDAELTVSAAGGGVEPNIKRWAGQFGNAEPKTEPRTVNGLKVTMVEIKGTFASGGGMMGGATTPKDKYMLLGAVVDEGDRQHFFKMTGPEKTVNAARKDFDAFVGSFRGK